MENINWITTQGDSTSVLIVLALGVLAFCFGGMALARYRRWMTKRLFSHELESLALTDSEQEAFSRMVLQHASDEPAKVLYSLPAFDRIVSREIERVLASAASQEAKETFISLVYDIRLKTFHAVDEEQVVAV